MSSKFQLNTGTPRSVTGHTVSGAIATALLSGIINYKKVKKAEMSKDEAIKDTIKNSIQGGIATGAAIATSNYLGQNNGVFKALGAASIGIAGLYSVEVIGEKLNKDDLIQIELEDK